jgi:hypothetical protein
MPPPGERREQPKAVSPTTGQSRAFGNCCAEAYQQHLHQKALHLYRKRVQLGVVTVLAL